MWVALTNADGDVVSVNFDNVAYYRAYNNGTVITFASTHADKSLILIVQENPARLTALIEASKQY